MSTESSNNRNNVDWSRYGLGNEEPYNYSNRVRPRGNSTGFIDLGNEYQYASGRHQASGANEIFAEVQGDKPWWRTNFFISQPILFGTWDGVFTSVLINIFGVIVFLRSGFIVAQAGIFSGMLIIIATVSLALISVLAAVGICERCRVESGGVYFLIAHTLGSRFGGSLGLLYCFGQAVGCALNVMASGFTGWSLDNFVSNFWSNYSDGYTWSRVFGIFFPTITGVLSGINMSGDLRAPSTDIPNGTLAAFGTSTFLYLMFVLFLGSTCDRQSLLTNYQIAVKVSAVQFLLLACVYVSSISSCLGAMYGTPRVLQSIALENCIPAIGILGKGRGPNKVPLYAMGVVATVTIAFIMVGDINFLAPIVTMPFLLTYACIDYSYFALAQTFDIQTKREERFRIQAQSPSYESRRYGAVENENDNDLDHLFPERTRHKLGNTSSIQSNQKVPSRNPNLPSNNTESTSAEISAENSIDDPNLDDNDRVTFRGGSQDSVNSTNAQIHVSNDDEEPIAQQIIPIHSKTKNWYSIYCNRWVSLFGAILKIVIMMFVNFYYGITCIGLVFLTWFYVKRIRNSGIPVLSTKQLSIKSPSSSPLLNYLTGRPLGKMEECEAFKAMESTSPTESLIDLLSFDLNGLYLPKKTKDTEASILEKIDCLRVHIQDLCLTRAGTREILSKNTPNESSFSSGNFTVEIDIDTILVSKSPFEKNTTFTSKVARIFSSSVETCTPCIEFNRTSVHKLNAFCIKSRNSYINGVISMDIRYRDIGSSASHILGTARFHLADVVQATNFTFQQHCPVKITSNEIIVGRLSIKAELGCRGLHFGGDFLEAISLNSVEMSKQSLPCEYFSRHSQYAEHLDSYKGYQCHKFDHRNDDFYYDSCLYDIHDEQTEDKAGNPSAPLNLEGHTNNDQKMNGNKLNNIVDEMSEKNLSHRLQNVDETSDDAEHGLKGLFHIGQINCCSWYQSTSETVLVCRPFWIDSALVTECCQNKTKDENYQLNYLEVFSVICDQKLFESTKHGFMHEHLFIYLFIHYYVNRYKAY